MRNSFRRACLRLTSVVLISLAAGSSVAWAQSYPDKSTPIKVVVPFPAGTSADALARAVARGITEVSGAPVIVDNKAGADGFIGMEAAKLARPDGYTMLLTTSSTQVVNPHLHAKLPYDPVLDFVPLGTVAKVPMFVNVGPSVPFKTARELIGAARANPGKYTFGGGTSTVRIVGEMLKQATGVDMLAVPYKNLPDAMMDTASGRIDFVIVDAATAGPFYEKGVRPIAVTTAARSSRFPDVPTLQEEGVAGFEATGWYAAYFPAKTPPSVVAAMRDILYKATRRRFVGELFTAAGMEPLDIAADDLDRFQREEMEKWSKAVRAANLGPKQ
ncbi:tripartite tricarboxylate transporter substrate binding protein [Variovorax guangxiensis]|jgi:tripartite-type tricarboxylate transporter receptor subunit TctC|uniref:Bug family tripartite tricarboxylate transporter substrate binding protein n=1 Tax=Variovorax guangxiensis TaxID=1775474 RepID=UPI002863C16A|nr:tripartite tricarboxylate transporter substrate binding protein [Variovorax guangxiensis]MDR6858769.1 tripartite-type tricarboxylate transporter receptor subunit TctC [Variovorax guangxiensis]